MSATHRWPARVVGVLLSFACVLAFATPPARAQSVTESGAVTFDIPAQSLDDALVEFGRQSRQQLFYNADDVSGLTANAVSGDLSRTDAMAVLLQGTGLQYEQTPSGGMMVGTAATLAAQRAGTGGPPDEAAPARDAGAAADIASARRAGVEEIIVTGQKKEERLQDVPIAISAFSMEQLDALKIEGGFDLLKAIPNVTFTKTNFTGYNFQIRGVGTQSISATSDPGAAVSFNSTAIIQNRLFEQEYLDIERVEVLRGPQGTLYGRNATAGVINVISNKPQLGEWDAMLDLEVGNYSTGRISGMFNVPMGQTLALRGAFASTDRDGYTLNTGTGNDVDGRDLWTGRLSLGWQPIDRVRADLIWERFEEDDNRLRTGKQLCHRDPGLDVVGTTSVVGDDPLDVGNPFSELMRPALFSQGCKPASLYSSESFETPNGLALPFVFGVLAINGDCGPSCTALYPIGYDVDDRPQTMIRVQDPYGGRAQSSDLRSIESIRDPVYRAEADLLQFNLKVDLTDELQLDAQTAYITDESFSFQDFNRFKTDPIFVDTQVLTQSSVGPNKDKPSRWAGLAPGGVFCDPQIGCSNTMAGFDIAQAKAEQFNQEVRLQSNFDGPVNFSVGVNYTHFETQVDYYVMFNIITAAALTGPFNLYGVDSVDDYQTCFASGLFRDFDETPLPSNAQNSICPYVDPSPVSTARNFEGDGHNYFRSKNPYDLESVAGFGELYWQVRDDTKLTLGLRYTDDRKRFTDVPSQVLLAGGAIAGGTVSAGYPSNGIIDQRWGEWTGRMVLDWKPVLTFTDETLIYGSYSRGYKGGGANPPRPGFASLEQNREALRAEGEPEAVIDSYEQFGLIPILQLTAVEYGPTFEPEFINAFEVGTKNTMMGGALSLNATAFYYDYTDYQVSQIRDRTAINENFDASMWGLELEAIFAPTPDWQFLANVGYLKTRIAGGETSIDIMNRTQGDPDYVLVKPWVQLPSNCVIPTAVAERYLQNNRLLYNFWELCSGGVGGVMRGFSIGNEPIDPATGQAFDVSNYPELNGGAGLKADLSGNELPNSPRLTTNVGAQYGFDMLRGQWRTTLRGDVYWQDDAYHRVYNLAPYDRLEDWYNINLAVKVEQPAQGLAIELYVKNVLDDDPITGAFLNSDDTGLTTNVFMLDPRLIGLSIRKDF